MANPKWRRADRVRQPPRAGPFSRELYEPGACNDWAVACVSQARPALMPVSLEREKAMQSICSLAATVLAIASPGGCATSNEAALSRADATDTQVAVAWNRPGQAESAFKFYMPKPVSPPRIRRPKWP